MSQFKLIAVTPLSGCSTNYCKNLTVGKPYQFYSDYQIKISEDNSEILSVISKNSVPANLYELSNGINLNFSAVVGKNGTGKSTIFELFSYFIYVLSTHKVLEDRKVLGTTSEAIEEELESALSDFQTLKKSIEDKRKAPEKEVQSSLGVLALALFYLNKYKLFMLEAKAKDELSFAEHILKELEARIIRYKLDIKVEESKYAELLSSLAVSIIYESEGKIQEAAFYNNNFYFSIFSPEKDPDPVSINDFPLESFFYSISVNFSHHGLNSNSVGRWINKLFHKNDAYTTPLVINPMRDEGNFDINHELNLSKERLHANLLFDLVRKEKTQLLGKYTIKEFIFTSKLPPNIFPFPFDPAFIDGLRSIAVLDNVLTEKNLRYLLPFWDTALFYLKRKIDKINTNYGFLIYKKDDQRPQQEQFNDFLSTDKSHITKKIRQVINFLKTSSLKDNKKYWKISTKSKDKSIRFDLEAMRNWLELSKEDLENLTPSELIEFGLPGFFKIDLLLSDNNGDDIIFSKLSSGEQQMILNSNGLLYQLSNINSAHIFDQSKTAVNSRIAYRNVNIILDEVELYYHPEMQRTLVSDLIRTFERVRYKGSSGIQAINVCILTHSPFILSDIPSQNVLNLTDGNSELERSINTQTFGANIHEMLIGEFFMESTTGEHVRTLIKEMLNLYSKITLIKSEKGFRTLQKRFFGNRDKFEFLVLNVGEEVVRSILKNHLDFMDDVFNKKVESEK